VKGNLALNDGPESSREDDHLRDLRSDDIFENWWNRKLDWEAEEELEEFFIAWDPIRKQDVRLLYEALGASTREQDMQSFLEDNPLHLVQPLHGGAGRWVLPHPRLGSQLIPDFLVGERDSLGYHWILVELESPLAEMLNRNGDPSSTLNHAIRQITDWRVWLSQNRDYAVRRRSESGLGLVDVDTPAEGLIIVGREVEIVDNAYNRRRRQMQVDLNINIHTYDWLLRNSRARAKHFDGDEVEIS
jgi:hypothetical protein